MESTTAVFEKEFTFPLSEADLALRSKEQAELHNRREAVVAEKREALAGFKGQIAGIDDRLTELANEITSGNRTARLKCERRTHPSAPRWQVVCLEEPFLHKVVGEEPMTLEEQVREKNGALPLHEGEAAGGDGEAEGDEARAEGDEGEQADASEERDAAAYEPREPAPEKKRSNPTCPRLLEKHAVDARLDQICGKEGRARVRGFCADCYKELGGKDGSEEMTESLVRRKARQLLEEEEARSAAAIEGTSASDVPPAEEAAAAGGEETESVGDEAVDGEMDL